MAQVTVVINGRNYPVACDAGEEARITELARYIDDKVKGFARDFGQIGEARLLVMAALLVADELAEAHEAAGAPSAGNGAVREDAKLAAGIDSLAQRIEAIAAKLETSHI
jgi:cell division protein ZapA